MIIDLNSEEQKMLLEILDLRLKLLSCDENVSLGLHTTDNEGNAKNICKTGLIIKSNRSFEGTVWPIGKIKDIEISDLNYFYRLGDYTIIVAVPPQFKVDKIANNGSGYESISDFSKLLSYIKDRGKK